MRAIRRVGGGNGSRSSCSANLLDVVVVDVAVAAGPDEVADLEPGLLRDHVRQQRVGGDVERDAEEQVGAALVELARQPAVGDVELEQRVTRRERHVGDVGRVPRRDDEAARVGVARGSASIDARRSGRSSRPTGSATTATARRRPDRARRSASAHSSQIVTPFSCSQRDVRLAAQEPQQLVGDRLQVHALGRDQREALRQVEAQLPAEHAARARAGAIGLDGAVLEHVAQQVFVRGRDRLGHRLDGITPPPTTDRGGRVFVTAGSSHNPHPTRIQPQAVSLGCCDPRQRAHRPRCPAGGDGRRRRLRAVAAGPTAPAHPPRSRASRPVWAPNRSAQTATLLQFSTELCVALSRRAPHPRGRSPTLTTGVRHLDVDLTHRPDIAKHFHVLQTPTTLVLDGDGVVQTRFGGVPEPRRARTRTQPPDRRDRECLIERMPPASRAASTRAVRASPPASPRCCCSSTCSSVSPRRSARPSPSAPPTRRSCCWS